MVGARAGGLAGKHQIRRSETVVFDVIEHALRQTYRFVDLIQPTRETHTNLYFCHHES